MKKILAFLVIAQFFLFLYAEKYPRPPNVDKIKSIEVVIKQSPEGEWRLTEFKAIYKDGKKWKETVSWKFPSLVEAIRAYEKWKSDVFTTVSAKELAKVR